MSARPVRLCWALFEAMAAFELLPADRGALVVSVEDAGREHLTSAVPIAAVEPWHRWGGLMPSPGATVTLEFPWSTE